MIGKISTVHCDFGHLRPFDDGDISCETSARRALLTDWPPLSYQPRRSHDRG